MKMSRIGASNWSNIFLMGTNQFVCQFLSSHFPLPIFNFWQFCKYERKYWILLQDCPNTLLHNLLTGKPMENNFCTNPSHPSTSHCLSSALSSSRWVQVLGTGAIGVYMQHATITTGQARSEAKNGSSDVFIFNLIVSYRNHIWGKKLRYRYKADMSAKALARLPPIQKSR